jgi:predicted RNase H-like nuclease (RuvC/YqgF family)
MKTENEENRMSGSTEEELQKVIKGLEIDMSVLKSDAQSDAREIYTLKGIIDLQRKEIDKLKEELSVFTSFVSFGGSYYSTTSVPD